MFYDAIHAKYPHMTVIASFPNSISTWQGDAAAPAIGQSGGDYHEYTRPDGFASEFQVFDNYTTEHPTLIGEYAHIQINEVGQLSTNWSAPKLKYPIWIGAVAEAIFELGAERNTDKIIGASYAPALQNLNKYEWAVSRSVPSVANENQANRINSLISLLSMPTPHRLFSQQVTTKLR